MSKSNDSENYVLMRDHWHNTKNRRSGWDLTDSEYDLQIKPFEVIFSKDINGNEVTESIQVDDAAGI